MPSRQATARAQANIAALKYWGTRDLELTLPTNGSLSMNLDNCTTETTVTFAPDLPRDELYITPYAGAEQQVAGRALERVVAQLERVRKLAGLSERALVRSRTSFPADAGIASSAAAFAALTTAAVAAAGLELSERELSRLTRLSGSGSACRSIPTGYVEWSGLEDDDSYARSIAGPEHWALADIVAVVDAGAKRVASETGHRLAFSSPYFAVRLQELPGRIERARQAILTRDMATLGEVMEVDATSMHVVAMTAVPPTFYWSAGTMAVIQGVRRWREQGLPCYWTIDAGANVHVMCEARHGAEVEAQLRALPEVQFTIANGPGPGARVVEQATL